MTNRKDAHHSPLPELIAEYLELKDKLATLVADGSLDDSEFDHAGLMEVEAKINQSFENVLAADPENPVTLFLKLKFLHQQVVEDCDVPGYLQRGLEQVVEQVAAACEEGNCENL